MERSASRHVWKTEGQAKTHPCIWMQSGAVKKKSCTHYYACNTCKYDQGMEKLVTAGKHISWQDAMRLRNSTDRICRHTMTQRTGTKICPMNYNCSRCDFDQYFEDTLAPRTGNTGVDIRSIKGFDLAQDYYFHNRHTWVSIESGGTIRVGMDDFSAKVFGAANGFELPLTGQELNRDTIGFGMKVKDHLADVVSPVNGIITGVNPSLRHDAAVSSHDPYGNGWLFTVHHPDPETITEELLKDEDSVQWLEQDIHSLETMIEDVAGPMSTDGGFIQTDVYGNLPALGWDNLTHRFLGT